MLKTNAKSYVYPSSLLLLLVFSGMKIRNAYFFSDDYTWLQNFNLQYIFEPYMGHLMYSLKIIYLPLYYLFGIDSYIPFLISSLLCMAVASFGIYRFCLRLGLGQSVSNLAAIIVLVLPNSEHTIFFLQAALQLLTFSSIFYVFVFSSHFKLIKIVAVTVYLAGTGGYGLPILVGLSLYFIFEREFKYLLVTSLALLVLFFSYTGWNSAENRIPDFVKINEYILESYWLTLENSFGSWLAGILIVVQIGALIAACIKRDFSVLKYPAVLFAALMTFYSLIFVARLGVESILAARYIALSNLMVVSSVILALAYVKNLKPISLIRTRQNLDIVSIVLIFGILHNTTGYYRALQNIEWGSKITIGQVSAIFCSQIDNSNVEKWQMNNSLRSLDYQKFLEAFKGNGSPKQEKESILELKEPAVSSYQEMLKAMKVPTSSECYL